MLKITLLYVSYIIYTGSLNTIRLKQAHINNIISVVGFIAGITILYQYWQKAFWFSPLVLLGASILLGPTVFVLFDRLLGKKGTYIASFVALPLAGGLCFYIISCLSVL